jgi:hypothetical protein
LDPLCARTEQQRASLRSRLLTCSPSISKRPLSSWMHARGTAAAGSLPGDRFSRPWRRETSYHHRERQGYPLRNPERSSRGSEFKARPQVLSGVRCRSASILGRSGADHALGRDRIIPPFDICHLHHPLVVSP